MPLNSHIGSTLRPPCPARSAINVQIASRPLLCAARLRRKNPVPTPAAPPCAPTPQSASAPPTTPRGRISLPLRHQLPRLPSAAFPRAYAQGRLRPALHNGPSTHTAVSAECPVPALPHSRFRQLTPGAPPLISTLFRTPADSCSFVT